MSRIGKKPVEIPQGVRVEIENQTVKVKGPKGELERTFPAQITVREEDGKILVAPRSGAASPEAKALWGLARTLVFNMIQGVTQGYEKKLEIEGVGYRANIEGADLVLHIGFSHPVKLQIPDGITAAIEKNTIRVSGIDKEKVGLWAAQVKRARPVEPYKGKGIRYEGEIVRRKVGKKAAGTTT